MPDRKRQLTFGINLEGRFTRAMHKIHKEAKEKAGYNASIFLNMLFQQGGLLTAKQLINAPHPSEGYTRLYEKGRLDLTVEALVVDNHEWHPLFTEGELSKARRRLKQYGYVFKDSGKG